jgi:hypothetical protein
MPLAAKIHDVRTTLSTRRTVRLAHRRLSDELATFVSGADRAELDAILERYTPEETRDIRTILGRRDADRPVTVAGFAGHR